MARKIITKTAPNPVMQADQLNIARVSDRNKWKDLAGKIADVWQIPCNAPSSDMIAKLGTDPLKDPKLVGGELHTGPDTRAVVFRVPDSSVWAVYVLGSAAKANTEAGDNWFSALIADLILQLAPKTVAFPTFDRLVRSLAHTSMIWNALSGRADRIVSSDQTIYMADPLAETRFTMAVLMSTADVDAIRRRFMNGRSRAWREGRSPLDANQMPLGYRLDRDKKPRIYLPDGPIIRAIVEGLGAGLPPAQIVEAAAKIGGSSPTLKRLHGPGATFADASNPSELVRGWRSWLELWETGSFEYTFECPVANTHEYGGFEVRGGAPGVAGSIIVPQDWGIPEGGWAPPAAFAACRKAALPSIRKRIPAGGSARKLRKPFTGRHWTAGQHEYKLFSEETTYQLRRRSLDPDRKWPGWGRHGQMHGQELLRVRAADLHEAVAHAMLAAMQQGVGGEILDMSVPWSPLPPEVANQASAQAIGLRRDIAAVVERVENLTTAIGQAADLDTIKRLTAAADRASSELRELTDQLARVQARDETANLQSAQTASRIFSAVGFLGSVENRADRQLSTALDVILPDFHIIQTPTGAFRWETHLQLPIAQGTLRLGPIGGAVPTFRGRRGGGRPPTAITEGDRLLAEFLASKVSIQDLNRAHNRKSEPHTLRVLHHALMRLGLPRQARLLIISRAVPGSAAQTLWRTARGEQQPGHLDPDWTKLVIDTYTGDRPLTSLASLRNTTAMRQAICDYLKEHSGKAQASDILRDLQAIGLTRGRLDLATTKNRTWNGLKQSQPPTAQRNPDGTIELITCPHCGGFADLVSLLPETPTGLLCRECRRTPDPESPIYPQDYLQAGWLRTPGNPARSTAWQSSTSSDRNKPQN